MVGSWKLRLKGNGLVALTGLATLAFVFVACGTEGHKSLEERAQSIDRSLICPVCPGETINQAQVELASQMRAVVREKLADGWTRDRILEFFVDRYGDGVLAAPPKSGFNLVAWVVPFASVGAAVVLLTFVIRSMRKGVGARPEEVNLVEGELEPYLSLVDGELGLARQVPDEPEKHE